MKPNTDEVLKTIKGLAIAAARAKEMAQAHGKDDLLHSMPRRTQDTVRQHLLDIEHDVRLIMQALTHSRSEPK